MRVRPSIVIMGSLLGCADDALDASGSSSSSGTTASAMTTESSTGGVSGSSSSSSGLGSSSTTGAADTTVGLSAESSSTGPADSSSGEPGSTTSGSSGELGTTAEGSGTSGGELECMPTYPDGDQACNDGVVVAGEVCYETQPPLHDAGTFATRVWAGDLDDDGDPDALVLVEFPAALTVALNNGLGNLSVEDSYTLVMGADTGSRDVAVGVMDGDAWVDAVVAFSSPPSLLVLANDGGGAFGFPIVTALPTAPNAVVVGDLDGDLLNDAVVADALGVTVHYGLGNGAFGMSATSSDPALVNGRDLAIYDFDGDGDLDVAVAFTQTVAVFLNDGGTLLAPSTAPVATSAFGPNDIAVGDVTLDGIPDILVADSLENEVHVLAGVGDGTFNPDPVPLVGRYVVVGDANADCNADVFTRTAPLMFDELTIYPSDGMGGQAAPQSFALHSGMVDMEGADFDGDTLTDILFAIGPSGSFGVSRTEP